MTPDEMLAALADGVGDWLANQGVPGVIIGQHGTGGPDQMVALRPYLIDTDRETGIDTVGMSIRFRVGSAGRAKPLLNLAGRVFELLDGLDSVVFGGVRVSSVAWRTSNEFKDDAATRPETADTYHFSCVRTSRVRSLSQQ